MQMLKSSVSFFASVLYASLFNEAKCNLGKVNLKPMQHVVFLRQMGVPSFWGQLPLNLCSSLWAIFANHCRFIEPHPSCPKAPLLWRHKVSGNVSVFFDTTMHVPVCRCQLAAASGLFPRAGCQGYHRRHPAVPGSQRAPSR